MTREEIKKKMLNVLEEEFDIKSPALDENLREKYEFDSIDAIDMLVIIEQYLDTTLTVEEKREAINIKTINDIINYVEKLAESRSSSVKE